jgi:hypothetical protein
MFLRVIKSRTMRWAGHATGMGKIRTAYSIFIGKLKVRDHSEDPGVVGRIILEWILGKYGRKVWTGFI